MSSERSGSGLESDLRGEVEKIKSNMDKVIGEIRGEIEELKNALVELKSSLSEVENPFNLLSSLVDEGGLGKIAKAAETPEKERAEPEKAEGAKRPEKEFQPISPIALESNYGTSIALIKWVWTLLDLGFDVDDVERISKYCEFFNLLPKGSSHYISAIASAVEKARALNLSEDMMALSIYGAAKASGVRVELEDITNIVFNALRKLIVRSPDVNFQR